jgi:hypothetical protein
MDEPAFEIVETGRDERRPPRHWVRAVSVLVVAAVFGAAAGLAESFPFRALEASDRAVWLGGRGGAGAPEIRPVGTLAYPPVYRTAFINGGVLWMAFEIRNTSALGITVADVVSKPPASGIAKVQVYVVEDVRFLTIDPKGPPEARPLRPFKLAPGHGKLIVVGYRLRDCGRRPGEPPVQGPGDDAYSETAHGVRYRVLGVLSRTQAVDLPFGIVIDGAAYCPRTEKAQRIAEVTSSELTAWRPRIRRVEGTGFPDVSIVVWTNLGDDERALAGEIAVRARAHVVSGSWRIVGASGRTLASGGSRVQP